MDNKKVRWTIGVLVVLVIVLAAFVIYAYGIQPAINGYTINAQQEGVVYALNNIVSQIQQNGYAQIPIGNQTLFLTRFDPEQLPQGQNPNLSE